jgi:hypothetical protein
MSNGATSKSDICLIHVLPEFFYRCSRTVLACLFDARSLNISPESGFPRSIPRGIGFESVVIFNGDGGFMAEVGQFETSNISSDFTTVA